MTEEVPPRPVTPEEFAVLPVLDLTAAREQWETLCSVATTEGLCQEPAVDPNAPLRICAPHLGLAVMVALEQLEKGKQDA